MSKVVKMVGMMCVITIVLTLVISGAAFASNDDGPGNPDRPGNGPAASSGDDKSVGFGPGPAPNSHDGIPDGPGW